MNIIIFIDQVDQKLVYLQVIDSSQGKSACCQVNLAERADIGRRNGLEALQLEAHVFVVETAHFLDIALTAVVELTKGKS